MVGESLYEKQIKALIVGTTETAASDMVYFLGMGRDAAFCGQIECEVEI